MIRVACLSFNNKYITGFNHNDIGVDYYDNITKINYAIYDFVIILNDQDKVDLLKCLKYIKKNFSKIIYIIDYNYSTQMLTKAFADGAHDYLTYPIKKDYLIQKIINEHKKTQCLAKKYYTLETLHINFMERSVYVDDKKINLTKIEYLLLELLINNVNKTLNKDEIYIKIWGIDIGDYRTLETHIKTLRSKIGRYRANIITVWKYGYAFMENIVLKQ